MDAKTIAWVSYLTFIGWIIAFVSHNNTVVKSPLATIHLRQSFGIVIFSGLIIWVIGTFFAVGFLWFNSFIWFLRVFLFILWLAGIISAVQGEAKPIPYIGPLFQQWFSFIK